MLLAFRSHKARSLHAFYMALRSNKAAKAVCSTVASKIVEHARVPTNFKYKCECESVSNAQWAERVERAIML